MVAFRCNVVALAAMGFTLVGLVAIGCVVFGIFEIASHDQIFNNDGLGEVLTVLGLYFTVPYVAILGFLIVVALNLSCNWCGLRGRPTIVILAVVIFLILVQAAVTDAYLYTLLGKWSLMVIMLDVVVLGAISYFQLSPLAGYCYTVAYAVKMALQWHTAYELKDEAFFGPNGMVAMLFLCIPIMQLPLYTSVLSDGSNMVEVFISHFNLFLSHLLHSLDIISMFLFAFTPPVATDETEECPTPLRWLILIQVVVGFIANNCSMLHLFYKRTDGSEAELFFLPKTLADATGRAELDDGVADDVTRSNPKRMFQYFLLMLVTVDAPFFVSRIELWRRRYYSLDLFVAKNLKDFVDVAMLLLRTEKQRERLALE